MAVRLLSCDTHTAPLFISMLRLADKLLAIMFGTVGIGLLVTTYGVVYGSDATAQAGFVMSLTAGGMGLVIVLAVPKHQVDNGEERQLRALEEAKER